MLTLICCACAGAVAAVYLTLKSPRLRSALKPAYRATAYRVLTALGRNPAHAPPEIASRMVANAKTQRDLARTSRIVQREADLILLETPLGRFWIPEMDRAGHDDFLLMVAEQLDNHYQYEGGAFVLDCGANLGTFTRMALIRGAKVVVAIEPAPDVVRCLRKTFAEEISLGRVILEQKGVWKNEDRLFLKTSEKSWENTIAATGGGQDGSWVALVTIDKMVADLKLPSVDFIKMDIEGAEVDALAGAEATIRNHRPTVSVATEHTADIWNNSLAVVRKIRAFGPYSEDCIAALIDRTRPVLGMMLPRRVVPGVMLFRPKRPDM